MNFAVIGLASFGRFDAVLLSRHHDVTAVDVSAIPADRRTLQQLLLRL